MSHFGLLFGTGLGAHLEAHLETEDTPRDCKHGRKSRHSPFSAHERIHICNYKYMEKHNGSMVMAMDLLLITTYSNRR